MAATARTQRRRATRRYDSSRRREQAAANRCAILDAAETLFVKNGYAPTKMAAIATDAGVSLKTVYLAFETKSGVLRALWNLRLRGDERPIPVGERPWYKAVLAEPDPEEKLRNYARSANEIRKRIGPVLKVIRDAAAVDSETNQLWTRMQAEFLSNQEAIVRSLHRAKALKPGLGIAGATDVMWTLNHPTVFLLLVFERGWSMKRYLDWLADALCSQLLADVNAG
jgi:AcrR family transcriptional regulator